MDSARGDIAAPPVDLNDPSQPAGALDEVSLGRTLQDARKAAGLTQQELCQKAGLSYSTLAKIERGAIKAPSVFTIQSVAAALGMTLSDLMGDRPPRPAPPSKKRSKSGVRFVYFDINGCLVRFYHQAFGRIAEDSGQPADVVETGFWHYNDAVCKGEMTMEQFNQVLGNRFGLTGFDWRDYYLAAVEPITEMHQLLIWAAEHYEVGLLSNIMPGQIEALLRRDLLPQVGYRAVIDSSEVGVIKPDRKIFEIAQAQTGVAPDEVLFVDDSRANIMAAEKLGWKVLWFDDSRPEQSTARVRTALEFAD